MMINHGIIIIITITHLKYHKSSSINQSPHQHPLKNEQTNTNSLTISLTLPTGTTTYKNEEIGSELRILTNTPLMESISFCRMIRQS